MNPVHQRLLSRLVEFGWREKEGGLFTRDGQELSVLTTPSGHLSFFDRAEPGSPSGPTMLAALTCNHAGSLYRVLAADAIHMRLCLAPTQWLDDAVLDAGLAALSGAPGSAQPSLDTLPLFPLRASTLDESLATSAALALYALRTDHGAIDGVRHCLPPNASSIWQLAVAGTDRQRLARRRRQEAPVLEALGNRADLARVLLETHRISLPQAKEEGVKPC